MTIPISYAEFWQAICHTPLPLILPLLFIYRILAATACPRLCHTGRFLMFCSFVLLLGATAWDAMESGESFRRTCCFCFLLACPSVISGVILVALKSNWPRILLSFALEMLLMPIWFFILFRAGEMLFPVD